MLQERTAERAFDWRSYHDQKSLDWPVRALMRSTVKRERRMHRAHRRRLNQGFEGHCVGNGWTAELQASPAIVGGWFTATSRIMGMDPQIFASYVYREAQKVDEWPGESYEGTSVLAGAKVVKALGYIDEYRWAFSIDDVIDSLITLGPVVIGIPWFESMYETRPSGLVEVDVVNDRLVGGHCLVLTGYDPALRLPKEGWSNRFEVCRWRNSWGEEYGVKGDGYVKVEDLAELLRGRYGGEACIPIGRHIHPASRNGQMT